VAPAVDAVARQTALIAVRFSPDGTAVIETVSPRQIPFPRAQAGAYDAELHGGRSGGGPIGLTDDPALPSGEVTGGGTFPAAHPMPARHDGSKHGAIVVRHPSLDTPIVTSVWLGHPGDAGGDVADRWQNGGSILRAPYYGEGTQYTLVRSGAEKLAEWRVH
jgi:hypothetical protein